MKLGKHGPGFSHCSVSLSLWVPKGGKKTHQEIKLKAQTKRDWLQKTEPVRKGFHCSELEK